MQGGDLGKESMKIYPCFLGTFEPNLGPSIISGDHTEPRQPTARHLSRDIIPLQCGHGADLKTHCSPRSTSNGRLTRVHMNNEVSEDGSHVGVEIYYIFEVIAVLGSMGD